MATVIGIMGKSGHGKTTSIETLDPKTTYYVDADRKGLSFKGWKGKYNLKNKNYYKTSEVSTIKNLMNGINEKAVHIKTVIVDTVNAIMIDDEMARLKEKGYDKWQDLAISVYDLIVSSQALRDDLVVVFIFHVQDDVDENGAHFYHILTGGKKLEKICLESKLTTVLYAKCIEGRYFFETQSKNSTAKSPKGMFETFEIPNDLKFVIDSLTKYEKGE